MKLRHAVICSPLVATNVDTNIHTRTLLARICAYVVLTYLTSN
jgi:hypothetical protein